MAVFWWYNMECGINIKSYIKLVEPTLVIYSNMSFIAHSSKTSIFIFTVVDSAELEMSNCIDQAKNCVHIIVILLKLKIVVFC